MIKRILDNKMVIGIICVTVAAVLAFLVLPGIYQSQGQTVTVCKLQTDIAAGTKIEKSMLKKAEVGRYGLPGSIVMDENQIIGKYAKSSISTDDLLLSTKFVDGVANDRLERIVSEGKKLVSVSVDSTAAGVANHLKAGDIVSLVCFIGNSAESFEELKHLEIYSIENESAINVEDVQADKREDALASTLTLIADEIQVNKLVFAEYAGKLHAVFEKRGGVMK